MNDAKRIDGKPLVCQGVRIFIDGKEAVVETQWAQGVHKVFKLDDGRQIFDLDKLVADGRAKICGEPIKILPPPSEPIIVPNKKPWSL